MSGLTYCSVLVIIVSLTLVLGIILPWIKFEMDSNCICGHCELCSPFMITANDNSRNFKETISQYSTIQGFLSRDECNGYVGIRSTNITKEDASNHLYIMPDIDGVCVEWISWNNIVHPIKHINILTQEKFSVKPIWSMLKKHVPLHMYKSDQVINLRHSFGTQLFYEYGWEYWIGFIPPKVIRGIRYERKTIFEGTYKSLCELRTLFQKNLRKEPVTRSMRNTLAKNNLNNVSRLFVLPDSCPDVLKLLQESFESCTPPPGFERILFSFRFGEKTNELVELPVYDMNDVLSVSIHIGAHITSIHGIDMLWSRAGVQNVIGQRGCVTTALSFYECANFQTNLDDRIIDISSSLRRICKQPENVRFFQLYADTPHRYPKTKPHPVSGAIISNNAVNDKLSASLRKQAQLYLSETENNFQQLSQSVCRLEFVVVPKLTNNLIDPENLLDSKALLTLLDEYPLLVPFSSEDNVISEIQKIGLHLVRDLKSNLDEFGGSGNSLAVWKSYQEELNIEKLLWGRPISSLSNLYAVNLGSGLGYPTRCKTDMLGFLALEECTSCMVDEDSTPPLSLWSSCENTKSRMRTLFGLHDYVESSEHVIGRKIIYILLSDLQKQNTVSSSFSTLIAGLKASNKDQRSLDGSVTLNQIGEILSQTVKGKQGLMFPVAIAMLKLKGRDVKNVIIEGIREIDLKFFPALHVWDSNQNRTISWKKPFKFWRICFPVGSENSADTVSSTVATPFVILQIENKKLFFSSRLKGITLPWIDICLRKLRPKNPLSFEQIVDCLVFVSCVAMLQNGYFVDFNKLWELVQVLPLTQAHMRALEILDKHTLPQVNALRINRLHQTIPYKLDLKEKQLQDKAQNCTSGALNDQSLIQNEIINDDLDMHIEDNQAQDVVLAESRHRPANTKSMWQSDELEILDDLKGMPQTLSWKQMYAKYTKECLKRGLPDRSFLAFLRKFKRL